MLRRYRCAAVVVSLLSAGIVSSAANADAKRSMVGARQADLQGTPPSLLPMVRTISVDKPDTGCAPPNDDRRSDLCAQWKAADSAYAAARWAWWQMVLGVGTLLAAVAAAAFAGRAAFQNRRAADFAETSIRVAEETARLARADSTHSREAAQAAERAYVLPVLQFQNMMENRRGADKFTVLVKFTNYGKTPAVISRISCACDVSVSLPGGPLESMFRGPSSMWRDEDERVKNPILEAGQSTQDITRISWPSEVSIEGRFEGVQLSQAHLKAQQSIRSNSAESGLFHVPPRDVDNPTCHYWVWGEVVYEDIFRIERRTQFCWALTVPHGDIVAFDAERNVRT